MIDQKQAPQKLPRDDAVTGIRALAILLVLASHMAIAQALPWPWTIKGSGQLGVMLFFLLSGYLMARNYAGRSPDAASRRYFLAARFGRVVPAYLVVLAVSLLVATRLPGWPYAMASWPELAQHLFFIKGKNALWAVPVEVQFYLLFFVLWVIAPTRWISGLALLAIPIAVALSHVAPLPGEGTRPLQAYLPYFFAGGALGVWLPRTAPQIPVWLAWPISLLSAMALLLAFPYLRRHFGFELPIWQDPLVFASLIFVFVSAIWRLGAYAILAFQPICWIGTISYGIYLWNPPVLFVVNHMGGAGPVLTPVLMVGLTVGIAALSWYGVEQPSLRWFRHRASIPAGR